MLIPILALAMQATTSDLARSLGSIHNAKHTSP
jgi:hypothetical protein